MAGAVGVDGSCPSGWKKFDKGSKSYCNYYWIDTHGTVVAQNYYDYEHWKVILPVEKTPVTYSQAKEECVSLGATLLGYGAYSRGVRFMKPNFSSLKYS